MGRILPIAFSFSIIWMSASGAHGRVHVSSQNDLHSACLWSFLPHTRRAAFASSLMGCTG